MENFVVEVYDIKDLLNQKKIDRFDVKADTKAEANSKAHDKVAKRYESLKYVINVRKL